MTDRERLYWECQRHLDPRPIRRRESAPIVGLLLMLAVGLALLGRVAFRLADQWPIW